MKYYSVGYSSILNKYMLSEVITWIAWYERYYEISEKEFCSLKYGTVVSERFNPEKYYVTNDENVYIGRRAVRYPSPV